MMALAWNVSETVLAWLLLIVIAAVSLNSVDYYADESRYINAMIEADNAYRAAIREPKQCKADLQICWAFVNHKMIKYK